MAQLRRIGIVGASLAGPRTAEALRAGGYDGEIALVGAEDHLPYNRPPLSKQFLTTAMDLAELAFPIRDGLDLDLRLGVKATGLRLGQRRLDTTSGPLADLDAVVIATGAFARTLALPGIDGLAGVHTLRSVDDALALRESLDRGGPVVVLGAGLIGCEIASTCRHRDLAVTLVDPADIPMLRAVGPDAGAIMADLHRDAGVDLRLRSSVTAVRGAGRVAAVELSDGSVLPADTLVIAVGSQAATDWLAGSGLTVADGVLCDEHLRVHGGDGRVLAVGDVCRLPAGPDPSHTERGEHWTGAVEQAGIAAQTLLNGPGSKARPIPFLWSEQHNHRLQAVGRIGDADTATLHAEPPSDPVPESTGARWTMRYTSDGGLVAAALDMPVQISRARRELAGV